jgi:hypothetical protein
VVAEQEGVAAVVQARRGITLAGIHQDRRAHLHYSKEAVAQEVNPGNQSLVVQPPDQGLSRTRSLGALADPAVTAQPPCKREALAATVV